MKIAGQDFLVRGRTIRVGRLEADGIEFLEHPQAVLDGLRQARAPIDVFTFVQTLPRTDPEFSYPMEWDNVAALPITTYDHWLTKQIDFKVRNKVRKGQKNGLTVREVAFDDDLVRGISAIYNETPVRQGKRFWHYGKDLAAVRRENATFLERSIFIGAFIQDQLVGFLKLVADRTNAQATILQILAMIAQRDKAPTNALIAQAVRSCAERGIPYFVYANFSYGKKLRDSLADFKQANGFQRMEVPRYYVPLTMRGRIALRAGLHHRVAERLPEPVLAKIRQIRSAWNARRFQMAKGAL
jgi:hypothetical protein